MKYLILPLWKRALIAIATVIVFFGVAILALYIRVLAFRKNYYEEIGEIPDHVDLENVSDPQPLQAIGRGIYDKNGDRVKLEGINFGNWLLQEGWMTVNSLGAKYNSKGAVVGYEETFQEEVYEAMYNNPNLTKQQVDELWEVYYDNYITEIDFANVKDIGMNVIRLPVYYRTFMEGDDEHLVMRKDAFKRLDWFLEMCQKYDLYAIIDMHGVVGGQSGFEHSGSRTADFWKNEIYIEQMCQLWENIAYHYEYERADLYETIAAYDLVNEPVDSNTPSTTRAQWRVMDRLFKEIRKVDSRHMISVECCWSFSSFPDPKDFGWDNVMYQIHLYNWVSDTFSQDSFYAGQDVTFAANNYKVPYLIGEFTFFKNENDWDRFLNEYDKRGWNWTAWSYKISVTGSWDSCWGIYVNPMKLPKGKLKLDLRTATYDEIYAEWSTLGTTQRPHKTGLLYRVLKRHFDEQHAQKTPHIA